MDLKQNKNNGTQDKDIRRQHWQSDKSQLFDEIIYGNDNLFRELPVLFCLLFSGADDDDDAGDNNNSGTKNKKFKHNPIFI